MGVTPMPATTDESRDPRVYLAFERTFLAWIRTGLALMALGFVVARFGLFLRTLEASHGAATPAQLSTLSVPLGVGLVLLGVVVNVASAWLHTQSIRALDRGTLHMGQPSRLGVALALILAAVGLAIAFDLGVTREGTPSMKTGDGIVSRPSKYSVPETLDRVEGLLRAKGIKVFARVDHSGEAATVGLTMPPTQVLIFGNPKGGTPIMLAAPTAAIDLPFKALAWQDSTGQVWLSYNDPTYLAQRFGLSDDQIKTLVPLAGLIEPAAN
jgi:uncharacterized protein (DUF302 family)/uncharacterized membrane protein YidH (DUF202 family)